MTERHDLFARIEALSESKRALLMRILAGRGQEPARSIVEPIAIVGLGCRFPGGAISPSAFWNLLERGGAGVREVPRERWDIDAHYDPDPDAPGKMSTRWGAFLDDVAGFDARFFAMAPREAARVDPQQRLLLEVAWEALEDAGQAPDRLRSVPVGVFVGISTNDYSQIQIKRGEPRAIDAYFGTGNALSMAAGRVSYVLGLQGPSVSVDTACSSSLVAVHLACQSLRSRESDLALAGGVNVMLLPEITVNFSKARMMASDGRCKSFDASADGYVRGEGCGIVVLKRLSDALAAGDAVRAVIRGSAVNHDGRSAGLTVPNGAAQTALIRRALTEAGLSPAEVQYVEAHGSGTPLGDPIELGVLAEIFQSGRSGEPLAVGSVKTNIGHLEAAAGIAGLIKVVLALRYGLIPPHLHLQALNPHMSKAAREISIPRRSMPWPSSPTRVAGVSSFGFSGTNAHVILASAPETIATPGPRRPFDVLALSAPSESALRALADLWARQLAEIDDEDWSDACQTSTVGRAHFAHRIAVVASDTREAAAKLSEPTSSAARARGARRTTGPLVSFLFTGQGAIYPSMGRALYETQPVFRAALERCDTWLRAHADLPLLDRIYGRSATQDGLTATSCGQPAIFSLQYALVEMWRAWGVTPDIVVGHSVGEFAAAWAAGVLEFDEALSFVAERGRVLQALPAGGAMATVQTTEEEAAAVLRVVGGELAIAAVNAPRVVTISGPADAVARALELMRERKIAARRLDVSHAFHSSLLDPALEAVEASAGRFASRPPRVRWISTLTGAAFDAGRGPDAIYWRRQVREPVLFERAVRTLAATGCSLVLEIGPTLALASLARRAWPSEDGVFLTSLTRGQDDWKAVLNAVADLYVHGVEIDWREVGCGFVRRVRPMPTYPFERQPHWIDSGPLPILEPPRGRAADAIPVVHPLLGRRVIGPAGANADGAAEFESEIGLDTLPYLEGHQVHGAVVLPAAGFVEMALIAARALLGDGARRVRNLTIRRALVLSPEERRHVRVRVAPASAGAVRVEVASSGSTASSAVATLHADMRIEAVGLEPPPAHIDLEILRARCTDSIPAAEFYALLRAGGFDYGSSFDAVTQLFVGGSEAVGRVELAPTVAAENDAYFFHPALLDGCIQVAAAALPAAWRGSNDLGAAFPDGIESVSFWRRPPASLWSHARLRAGATPDRAVLDVTVYDEAGDPVGDVHGLGLVRLDAAAREPSSVACYEVVWRPVARKRTAPRQSALLVLSGDERLGADLVRAIGATGQRAALAPFDPSPDCVAWRERLSEPGWTDVVYAASSGPTESFPSGEDVVQVCEGLRRVVAALPSAAPLPRLIVVTHRAQAVDAGDDPPAPLHSALWGFTRALALERPELEPLLVDVDDESDAQALASLLVEELDEDEIAFRHGRTFAPRLARGRAMPARCLLSADATFVVTGGFGALGFEVACRLAARGARHLVLLGRTPHVDAGNRTDGNVRRRDTGLEHLAQLGARVMAVAADVTSPEDLAKLREELRTQGWPEIRGVVHAAGVLGDRTVGQLDAASLRGVVLPKVEGLRQLERLLAETPLDFFVVFSSAAATLGSAGQASYAAANAVLDCWAAERRRGGRPALAVAWAGWRGVGMAARLAPGTPMLNPEAALETFERLLASDAAHLLVLPADARAEDVVGRRSLLTELRAIEGAAVVSRSPRALRDRLRAASDPGRRELVLAYVREKAAVALGLTPLSLDVRQPLSELGLDSLMAIEMRTRLIEDLGVTLPVARVLEEPSVERIAAQVITRLEMGATEAAPLPLVASNDEFPLSRGQTAMWFLQQLAPESTAYHLGDAVVVGGPLDVSALGRAFESLTERHPALRTTIVTNDGDVRQRVHVQPPVSGFEHRDRPRSEPRQLVEELRREMERPFDLERGPLTRLIVLSRRPDEHYLLLSMHHIVGELWALILLVQELSRLYKAETRGLHDALPRLAQSYAAFVAEEQRLLAGPDADRLAAYWTATLATLPSPITLPTARPRPPVQTYRGALHAFRIEKETGQGLKDLARQEETTLFTSFLAAFMLLLGRESGQTDLVVGSPMTGRTRPEWSGIVGYFDNPVPLRGDLTGHPSFRELVRRVRATVLEAFEHQAYPFPLIVERLQPARDPSRSPLFDVMFVLRKSPVADLQRLTRLAMGQAGALLDLGDGLRAEALDLDRRISQLDLTLAVTEEGGEFFASWEYNADLFDLSSIELLTGHLLTLIGAATMRPDDPIDALPIITETERRRAFGEWNATDASFPADRLLHHGFEEHVRRTPDALAVISDARRLTYGELGREADAVAGWLRRRHVVPNRLVAVVMHKGWEQVVAVLGILKAGGAYVPIDARLPHERIRHLLDRCEVGCALTQRDLSGQLPCSSDIEVLVVQPGAMSDSTAPDLVATPTPADLAYVIFTSGSTGLPKGVMIDHRGAWNTVHDVNRRFNVGPSDRVVALSSLSFDLSVYDIFGTLAAGGAVVIPTAVDAQDPAHWADLSRREGVTIWNSVPALLHLLVQYLDARPEGRPSALRLALLSGDWIPVTLPDQARRLFPALQVVGMGGATEASIWSILHPIDRVDPAWKSIPYGRPMANQKVFVLDGALDPCAVGVSGHLHIGGIGLARGYWKDEERSSASFFVHPRTGERLYRTGDLGRYLSHGTIEFLGRADTQVKIRGFRVELGEIEAVLARLRGIRHAVVTAREDEPGSGKRLVAYLVSEGLDRPAPEALRRAVAGSLPDYMMPSGFVFIDRLPLSPNGKVDRHALPAPEDDRPVIDTPYVAPRDFIEEQLAAIWSDVLRVSRVGVRDNFFALGGDSIQSIQISVRAAQAGMRLSPRQIFEGATIAAVVEGLKLAGDAPSGETAFDRAPGPPDAEAVLAPTAPPPSTAGGPPQQVPADFPLARLNERELQNILARFGGAAAGTPDGGAGT